MQKLHKERARRIMQRATTKRADAEAIQIKGRIGRRRTTINRADAEGVQIKDPQRDAKRDNKEGG